MRARLLVAALAAAAFLAGCGEDPQVTVYKQGKYQGKPDSLPWAGPPFNDNHAEWEKAIRARNKGQNEYARIGS